MSVSEGLTISSLEVFGKIEIIYKSVNKEILG